MSLFINNGDTALDETVGLQADDVASLGSNITADINAAISSYLVTLEDAMELASGDGAEVLFNAEGNISSVDFAFTNGTDTMINTIGGEDIFLQSTSDPNVVVGVDALGDIAFVIAKSERTDAQGNVTGVDFYTSLFQPISHIDNGANVTGDVAILGEDVLSIVATETLEFSFDGAPAGQNVFMAFGDNGGTLEDRSILVTGKTVDDSVNSGKGGGDTTLGTNSQNIEPGAGLNISFITGMNPDFVVDGLTSTEASDVANIDYLGLFNATEVSVQLVKVSTSPKTEFSIRLTAYTDSDGVVSGEQGANHYSGFVDDTPVLITGVEVNGETWTNWTIAGDSAVVSGLKQNDTVTYTTTDSHTRILIENAQPLDDNLQFSIANFEINSAESESLDIASQLPFWDDVPGPDGNADPLALFEDELSDGNPGGTGSTDTFDLSTAVAEGVDTPLTYTFDGSLAGLPQLTSGGVDLDYTISGGVFTASLEGQPILTVSVSSAGLVTATLSGPIDHNNDLQPGDQPDGDTLTLDLSDLLSVVDADNDPVALADPIIIIIEDDAPIVAGGATGNIAITSDATLGSDTVDVSDAFTVLAGADGEAGRTYELVLPGGEDSNSGLVDAVTDSPVLLKTDGDAIIGFIDDVDETEVFRLTIDSDGVVTQNQLRAVEHDDSNDPVEAGNSAATLTAGSVAVKLTVEDGDVTAAGGDTDDATVDISTALRFTDDGPDVTLTGADVPELTTDDDDINTPGTDGDDFSGLFTVDYGNDGPGTDIYALSLTNIDGGALESGLIDVESGDPIVLSLNAAGTVITGIAAGETALTITLDPTDGSITQTQTRAIAHTPDSGPNQATGFASDKVEIGLTQTSTDGDADSDADTANITGAFKFLDDAPEVTGTAEGRPTLVTGDSEVTDMATANFAGQFAFDAGNDGAATGGGKTFDLTLTGSNSGLVDTLTVTPVTLALTGSVISGTNGDGDLVLQISVDADGIVKLEQLRAVVHDDANDSAETAVIDSNGIISVAETFAGDVSIGLSASLTDKDGDVDSDEIDITSAFGFEDDGPNVTTRTDPLPTITTDDPDTPNDTDSANLSSYVTTDFGEDGEASANATTYALTLNAEGVDSGLTDTVTQESIKLRTTASGIEGYLAVTGAVAFLITVSADGTVAMEQDRAIDHSSLNPEGIDASTATISLEVTATDGDGDTDIAPLNITEIFAFTDDAPDIDVSNMIGSGTTAPQVSEWSYNAGADELGSIGITANGYTVGGAVGSESISVIQNDTFNWTISVTDDLDQNPETNDTTFSFDLTLSADGTYTVEVEELFGSVVTASTANGQLEPGGPDPVQTLTIPLDGEIEPLTVVFFGVNPLDTQANLDAIKGLILPGAGELTEAEIEALNPSVVGDEKMNVSTSGIGVDNNNLDGDRNSDISAGDESFVSNPFDDVTGAKVFIDNSVGGYSSSEKLYYTIYYENGDTSGPTLVAQGDLTSEPGKQKSFVIGTNDGSGDLIDAIQLTMADGTVKIPTIEYYVSRSEAVDPLEFDLTATIIDGDGSQDSDGFTIVIETDEVPTTPPDITLEGITAEADVFNLDFGDSETVWEVIGFEDGVDLLSIMGVASSDLVIDNSGDDAIITVNAPDNDHILTVFDTDIDAFDFV